MKVFLENVNISSRTGPNYFGSKLVQYMKQYNCSFESYNSKDCDVHLSFIESNNKTNLPL